MTQIAKKFGVSLKSLEAANSQIKKPGKIFPEQKINIPEAQTTKKTETATNQSGSNDFKCSASNELANQYVWSNGSAGDPVKGPLISWDNNGYVDNSARDATHQPGGISIYGGGVGNGNGNSASHVTDAGSLKPLSSDPIGDKITEWTYGLLYGDKPRTKEISHRGGKYNNDTIIYETTKNGNVVDSFYTDYSGTVLKDFKIKKKQ